MGCVVGADSGYSRLRCHLTPQNKLQIQVKPIVKGNPELNLGIRVGKANYLSASNSMTSVGLRRTVAHRLCILGGVVFGADIFLLTRYIFAPLLCIVTLTYSRAVFLFPWR
jgi:hypothetical protein